MGAAIWYAISLILVPAVCCVIRINWLDIIDLWRALHYSIMRRSLLGAILVQAATVGVYIATNISILAAGQGELLMRSATLAGMNLIPLFLGARASFLCNYCLRIPLPLYRHFHRCVGLMVVFQGLLHTVLGLRDYGPRPAQVASGSMAMIALCLILVSSAPPLWELLYQVFPKTHLTLAIVLLAATIWHLRTVEAPLVYPGVAVALWLVNLGLWLSNVVRYTRDATASIVRRDEGPGTVCIQVFVNPRDMLRPGQYFYLYFPELPAPSMFHASPLMPYRSHTNEQGTILYFIMEREGKIGQPADQRGRSVIVDGPWGVELGLERYEAVTLYGEGIGSAGLLVCAVYLDNKMKEPGAVAIRTCTLRWKIGPGDRSWFAEELATLQSRGWEVSFEGGIEASYMRGEGPLGGELSNRRAAVGKSPRTILKRKNGSNLPQCADRESTYEGSATESHQRPRRSSTLPTSSSSSWHPGTANEVRVSENWARPRGDCGMRLPYSQSGLHIWGGLSADGRPESARIQRALCGATST